MRPLTSAVMAVALLGLPLAFVTFPISLVAETNVSGQWAGSFDITLPDGSVKKDSAFLNLKQDGQSITGSAGPDSDTQMPISDGKIVAQKVQFKIEQGSEISLRFDLHLEGAHLKGQAVGNMPEGKVKVALDVVRVDEGRRN